MGLSMGSSPFTGLSRMLWTIHGTYASKTAGFLWCFIQERYLKCELLQIIGNHEGS